MDFSTRQPKSLAKAVNNVDCVFYPISAVAGVKLAHRLGQALAKAGKLAPLASRLADAGGKAPAGAMTDLIELVELVLVALEPALLAELIAVTDAHTIVAGVRGPGVLDQNFQGDIYGLAACIFHVLTVSGFFPFLAGKS